MAEWRKFNATNHEETCLWCGRKLKFHKTQTEKPADMDWNDWWADPRSKERVNAYDKPGDYGDGYFCGLRCGYSFGEAMAKNRNRLAPREED